MCWVKKELWETKSFYTYGRVRIILYDFGTIWVLFYEPTHEITVLVGSKKQVSMIGKYHNHKLQTNPQHHETVPQNNNNHKALGRQRKVKHPEAPFLGVKIL